MKAPLRIRPVRMDRAALSFVSCASLLACATPPASPPDPMCAEIRNFANATPPDATRSVELVVEWFPKGGSDERVTVSRADCSHGGHAPGRALCDWLVPHTSREFPESNVERALACMGDVARRDAWKGLSVRALSGEVEAREMPGVDEDVRLTATFAVERGARTPLLRIVAQRRHVPD